MHSLIINNNTFVFQKSIINLKTKKKVQSVFLTVIERILFCDPSSVAAVRDEIIEIHEIIREMRKESRWEKNDSRIGLRLKVYLSCFRGCWPWLSTDCGPI